MTKFVGIDLGTTNSVICSYDGESLTTYKSPAQQFATPSAIHIDRRGSRYYGAYAYDMAAHDPDNTATNFKRLMGSSTPIYFRKLSIKMTPEECSAEILRVLFGYLPEEVRNNPETGTVITVPAAFNQMQKDSTLSAAEMAGIGKVALMQEPVATVMSVMRSRRLDGMFLVYDLGGGTLDVSLAQIVAGRVSLLEHGGKEMCGGRDFDKAIVEEIVTPWLMDKFKLPENVTTSPRYKLLFRLAELAAEKAKIELSAKNEANIMVSEEKVRITDEAGEEIYIDVPINRTQLDSLIRPKVLESVEVTKEILQKAHLSTNDIERIVFIGGPTQYKPLREIVCSELGIPGSTEVDPMTAVAEGAALFAESINWDTESRERKSTRGTLSAGGPFHVVFTYQARTPDVKSLVVIQTQGKVAEGSKFQIDSLDSGWSSGRQELMDGATVALTLSRKGDNKFKVFVFDPAGGPISLPQDTLVISRTAATVDAIPASHSIGVAAKDKIGGQVGLEYLVRAGDPLPKKGQKIFRSEESIRGGGPGAILFKLWEGEIESPYSDNRLIGCFKITGKDFEEGVIPAGAKLICEYEVTDAGNITMTVTVPDVGCTFNPGHNFYSRQEGQIDYTNASKQIVSEGESVLHRLDEIAEKVADERLEIARQKLTEALSLNSEDSDPERCKQGMDNVLESKRLLSKVRKDHLREIRAVELEKPNQFFQEYVRQYAKPTEITAFENLTRAALRAIEQDSGDFENLLDQMREINWQILWRQDWFVVDTFKRLTEEEYLFTDRARFAQLAQEGLRALRTDDFDQLRRIVGALYGIRISPAGIDDTMELVNILRG
ncbi:MAG: Hsp70 family protein [Deltaproteobacteria bacterium]|nr:Hsp70 family protein [Deltaproteobacteria bacterium]